jgi:drug/metabolite transporter (DMT)-like permease
MTLPVTAVLAGLCLALTVLFGWLGARPPRPHRGPRLVPWRFLMLLAFTGMVALLVHVVALLRDPMGLQP